MAKKARLALSRLPFLLQVPNGSESSSNSLIGSLSCWGAAAAIGGTCLGRLSGGDTRLRKVGCIHSLTYPSLCQVHVGSNTGYVGPYVRKTAEETAPEPPHVPQQQQ